MLIFRCLFGVAVNILGGLQAQFTLFCGTTRVLMENFTRSFIFANLILLRIYCAIFVFVSLQFDCFSVYDKLNGYYAYMRGKLILRLTAVLFQGTIY